MQNKLVMVTGANAGIGKVTARELAKMGAHVVMVCRNRERGEAAQADIKAASGSDKVDLLLADLSSQASIRQLAADFKSHYDRLDVLVNNAGVYFMKRSESVDGIEMTLALNHLGYFLLTNLLLDTIKASAPARIVNVSSTAHHQGEMDFDDLQMTANYKGFAMYGRSKLANILFTKELARRLAGTAVTVNCLHPGFVATNFATNNGLLYRIAMRLIGLFRISLTPDRGAETSIYLASSPTVADITGEYFDKKKVARASTAANDMATAQRLWQISEQLTNPSRSKI